MVWEVVGQAELEDPTVVEAPVTLAELEDTGVELSLPSPMKLRMLSQSFSQTRRSNELDEELQSLFGSKLRTRLNSAETILALSWIVLSRLDNTITTSK